MIKSIIPAPPVYPDGVLASTLLQHVDTAISLAWEALLENIRGEFLEGTPIQMRSIFDRLATIRREILTASIPEHRYRLVN